MAKKKKKTRGAEMPDVAPAPEVKEHDVTDAFEYDVAFNLAFVGVGQGGGRLAEAFYNCGYSRVAAINTDHADLSGLDEDMAKLDLQMGGAGKDPAKGRNAVRLQEEAVFDLLTRAVGKTPDYLMVCAGAGGGTGSGAAAEVVKIARRYMEEHDRDPKRVGVILTLPLEGEGQRVCRNALATFKEIHELGVTPFFILDNKRIHELFRRGVTGFYEAANAQVAAMLHLFNRLAAAKGTMVTFDRADFASLLDSGISCFGASLIEKYDSPADISQSIREQLQSTVLAEIDLRQGRGAGCVFVGSDEVFATLPMEFFDAGFSMLNRMLADDSVVHRGIYPGLTDDLRCYTMVSQLPPPKAKLQRLAKVARVSGGDSEVEYLGVE